jgi:hypothetical protein
MDVLRAPSWIRSGEHNSLLASRLVVLCALAMAAVCGPVVAGCEDGDSEFQNEIALPSVQKPTSELVSLRVTTMSEVYEISAFPGRKLLIPCGTFIAERVIDLPSNTEIEGAGPCTILKMAGSMKPNINWFRVPGIKTAPRNIFSNADFISGNTNIHIHDLTLDGTDSAGNAHLASFYNTSQMIVERIRFIGSGTSTVQDGVSFVHSEKYKVAASFGYNMANACYDQWDGVHDFVIVGNVCDGQGRTLYGILVNGLDSNRTRNISHHGVINSNELINLSDMGINVSGLWNLSQSAPDYGEVKSIRILNNTISNVRKFYGIRVADGRNILLRDNTINNVGRNGLRIGSQYRGVTSCVDATENKIINSNRASVSEDAIRIVNNADRVRLRSNIVLNGGHRFAVRIDDGVTETTVEPGSMTRGDLGFISDGGRGTTIQDAAKTEVE